MSITGTQDTTEPPHNCRNGIGAPRALACTAKSVPMAENAPALSSQRRAGRRRMQLRWGGGRLTSIALRQITVRVSVRAELTPCFALLSEKRRDLFVEEFSIVGTGRSARRMSPERRNR